MMLRRFREVGYRSVVRTLTTATVSAIVLFGGTAHADYCATDSQRVSPDEGWPSCLNYKVDYWTCYAGTEKYKVVRHLYVSNECSYHVKIKVEQTILFDYKIDLDPGDSEDKDWGFCNSNVLQVYHCPQYDGRP